MNVSTEDLTLAIHSGRDRVLEMLLAINRDRGRVYGGKIYDYEYPVEVSVQPSGGGPLEDIQTCRCLVEETRVGADVDIPVDLLRSVEIERDLIGPLCRKEVGGILVRPVYSFVSSDEAADGDHLVVLRVFEIPCIPGGRPRPLREVCDRLTEEEHRAILDGRDRAVRLLKTHGLEYTPGTDLDALTWVYPQKAAGGNTPRIRLGGAIGGFRALIYNPDQETTPEEKVDAKQK